jgi:CRP/FNR family transcriptional regulator
MEYMRAWGAVMFTKEFCMGCPLSKTSCLWTGLRPSHHDRLRDIIKIHPALRRGYPLFHTGERLRALYVLRSGNVKTWNVTSEGEDHIIRFHMPGDVLGLGAISGGVHDCNATTLDTCSVCGIPFKSFQRLAEEIPILNHQLLKMMSREIALEEERVLLRGHKSAPARLATFLYCLTRNFAQRGYSTQEFMLTMGRRDIANYLGLALETVSRTLTQLHNDGVLSVDGKYIRVTNPRRLSQLSGLPHDSKNAGEGRQLCHM